MLSTGSPQTPVRRDARPRVAAGDSRCHDHRQGNSGGRDNSQNDHPAHKAVTGPTPRDTAANPGEPFPCTTSCRSPAPGSHNCTHHGQGATLSTPETVSTSHPARSCVNEAKRALLRALDVPEASRNAWHAELRAFGGTRRLAKGRGTSTELAARNPYREMWWSGAPREGALHPLSFPERPTMAPDGRRRPGCCGPAPVCHRQP